MINWLTPLQSAQNGALDDLVKLVIEDRLQCRNRHIEDSGDIRYWEPRPDQNPLLAEFRALAVAQARAAGAPQDVKVVLMVNHISAETCPTGSGGGWHVDSIRQQYKLFCYLTDCESESLGPLCLLQHPLPGACQVAIYLNRLFGGNRRFNDKWVKAMKWLGFQEAPVLTTAGRPFFVKTSQIHRGMQIRTGHRIMITAYIFNKTIPSSVMSRLDHADAQAA